MLGKKQFVESQLSLFEKIYDIFNGGSLKRTIGETYDLLEKSRVRREQYEKKEKRSYKVFCTKCNWVLTFDPETAQGGGDIDKISHFASDGEHKGCFVKVEREV